MTAFAVTPQLNQMFRKKMQNAKLFTAFIHISIALAKKYQHAGAIYEFFEAMEISAYLVAFCAHGKVLTKQFARTKVFAEFVGFYTESLHVLREKNQPCCMSILPLQQLFALFRGGKEARARTRQMLERKCSWCDASVPRKGTQRCSRCGLVCYCDEACQQMHWTRAHKYVCA